MEKPLLSPDLKLNPAKWSRYLAKVRKRKPERVVVGGDTAQEVAIKAFDIKNLGYRQTSPILQSEVTSDFYQWWEFRTARQPWLERAVKFLREREL